MTMMTWPTWRALTLDTFWFGHLRRGWEQTRRKEKRGRGGNCRWPNSRRGFAFPSDRERRGQRDGDRGPDVPASRHPACSHSIRHVRASENEQRACSVETVGTRLIGSVSSECDEKHPSFSGQFMQESRYRPPGRRLRTLPVII